MPQKRKRDFRDTPYRRLKDAKDYAIGEIGDYVDYYWKLGQRGGSPKQNALNVLVNEVHNAKTVQKVKGVEKKLKNRFRKY